MMLKTNQPTGLSFPAAFTFPRLTDASSESKRFQALAIDGKTSLENDPQS